MLLVDVQPALIGVGLLTLGPAFFLLMYGIGQWVARGWRLSVGRTPGIIDTITSPIGASTTIALLLVIAFELAIVYNGNYDEVPVSGTGGGNATVSGATEVVRRYDFSFMSTAWAFLGANAVLAMGAVHLWASASQHYDLDLMTSGIVGKASIKAPGDAGDGDNTDNTSASQPASGAGADGPSMTALSAAEAGIAAGEAGSATAGSLALAVAAHVRMTSPPPAATWFDRRAAQAQAGGRRLLAMVLYVLSVLVLVGLAVTVLVLSGNTADEGKGLGITTAVAVLVLDGITALGFQGGLFLETGTVLLVLAASRFLLLAAGTKLWLLGIAMAYAAYGVFLAYKSASRYFSALVAQLHDLAGSGSSSKASAPAAAAAAGPGPMSGSGSHPPGSVAPAPPGSPQRGTADADAAEAGEAGGPAPAPAPAPGAGGAAGTSADTMGSSNEVKAPISRAKAAGMCGGNVLELLFSPLFLLVLLTVVFAGLVALLAYLQGEVDFLPNAKVSVLDS